MALIHKRKAKTVGPVKVEPKPKRAAPFKTPEPDAVPPIQPVVPVPAPAHPMSEDQKWL